MISAGREHSIFVDSDGSAYSCGGNQNGKLFFYLTFHIFQIRTTRPWR